MEKKKVWTIALTEKEIVKLDKLAFVLCELGKISQPKRAAVIRESLLLKTYENAMELYKTKL